MKLTVVIHEAEEGGYWAEVPALRGCFTEGETLDEVRANLREAIEGYLDESPATVPAGARLEEIELWSDRSGPLTKGQL